MIPVLSDLELLARQAGEILRQGYGKRHRIDYKGAIDLVTDIDRQSEALLLGEISSRFPDHQIWAEESGVQEGSNCCRWLVDPLDGTVNYAHGMPIFSVSLAFQLDGVTRLGVVYDPMRDECFSAERDAGARLNGEPIRVSDTPDLDHSLLVTGFHYNIRSLPAPDNNLGYYSQLSLLTQGVRRLGSAALDLCYVASGRFDGYWELKLAPWDVAAGALIAEEAGATVTSAYGAADFLEHTPSALAANPSLHRQILAVLLAAKQGSK